MTQVTSGVINSGILVTKAGVPTKKIMVGESSYGRSFGMSQAGCTANNCTFEGSSVESVAEPGACTNTAGYISNAEINDIIAAGNVKTYHDGGSNSDILVYDGAYTPASLLLTKLQSTNSGNTRARL